MDDTEKYLIHAFVTADGVVERSDVVGAIFGQTEGLLGDELDLPELRRTGKLGRIDVSVASHGGESRGEITIATSLDKVETATLAAALETIDRVGPCHATFSIDEIEDVRAAKRRAVVDRATELLRSGFDDSVMSSAEILSAVREHVRVADITEYEELPAGPNVVDSDAIIVVEGRSDVLTLLRYGIKNAIGVEGTNVPEDVASLTRNRTVTAFLDADRGGELILEELRQVGDVDYVARPPTGSSVEDLDHHEVFTALKEKEPIGPGRSGTHAADDKPVADTGVADSAADEYPARPASSTDGGTATIDRDASSDGPRSDAVPRDTEGAAGEDAPSPSPATRDASASSDGVSADDGSTGTVDASATETTDRRDSRSATGGQSADVNGAASIDDPAGADGPSLDASGASSTADGAAADTPSSTLYDHVDEVIDGTIGTARFLDEDRSILDDHPANEAKSRLEATERVPSAIVLDDILSQDLLDVAASRGVSTIVARTLGQFVKRPVSVRVHDAESVARDPPGDEREA
ncbi:DNA primase DnaG [Halovivax cerinus]|uniref:DNA primase DnaG n=1 Tax=Halovivax cerinus TaxID=1487865 RepID=A0ABD5NM49_9EURY|nr:DNA primase DnaG [Halovivax cerinus]